MCKCKYVLFYFILFFIWRKLIHKTNPTLKLKPFLSNLRSLWKISIKLHLHNPNPLDRKVAQIVYNRHLPRSAAIDGSTLKLAKGLQANITTRENDRIPKGSCVELLLTDEGLDFLLSYKVVSLKVINWMKLGKAPLTLCLFSISFLVQFDAHNTWRVCLSAAIGVFGSIRQRYSEIAAQDHPLEW